MSNVPGDRPANAPNPVGPRGTRTRGREQARDSEGAAKRDRSSGRLYFYRSLQYALATFFGALGGWRATGRQHIPPTGGVLLVSNHLSFLDVIAIGIPLQRPLNYVARSTLFVLPLGSLIRALGGFPIQRDGLGASGVKETLRRLKNGGIVVLYPEGTRSPDGQLGEIKPGIAVLVSRAKVPVVPAGIAGTYEGWPRSRLLPRFHPWRIHYGRPIFPAELDGLDADSITGLIRERIRECVKDAQDALGMDLGKSGPQAIGLTD